MAELEKVIKGLEICTTRPCYCTDCPYKKDCILDSQEVMEDALELLKERVPVQADETVINEIDRLYRCPSCHIALMFPKQKYCHWCGQAVKWE